MAPTRLRSQIGLGEACLAIELPSSAEELPRILPRRMARNLRLYRNRAEKLGRVCLEHVRENTLPALLDSLLPSPRMLERARLSWRTCR